MSTNPDSTLSRLWLDGDAFRAPVGTALPGDDTIFTPTVTGFDAFGGIQAGFTVNREQTPTEFTIWNRKGTYRQRKDEPVTTIAIRVVDQSAAAVLTVLRGGSVLEVSADEVYEWQQADDEEFALLLNAIDPTHGKVAYYAARCALNTDPSDVVNDEALAGWDFDIKVLAPLDDSQPIRKFTDTNPLGA